MKRRSSVHNPATGTLKPVELITDRAKRYRAQAANQQEEHVCIYCGQPGEPGQQRGGLHVEHINGREDDTAPENLAYACRPCNTAKGAYFARVGFGVKTRQYNPTKTGGAANVGEWIQAVGAIVPHKGAQYSGARYGLTSSMSTADAVAMIRATPPARRAEYASKLRKSGRGRRPADEVPF